VVQEIAPYIRAINNKNNKTMNTKFQTLLSAYETLEAKQDNGTITMTEEAVLCSLSEMLDEMLFNK
jgi:predicted RND superfamily exporter protein